MDSELLLDVTVGDGKYRIIQHKTGLVEALRYGETWLTVTGSYGSNMILAMAHELEELRQKPIAASEEAFKAGFDAAIELTANWPEEFLAARERAWSEYDPPEDIKALV